MRLGPGKTTPMVRNLLVINGIIFLLQMTLPRFGLTIGGTLAEPVLHPFGEYLALVPENLVTRGFLWQLVTYQFLHGGLFHILINMLVLWMFGVELERVWGAAGFLRFYLICGIVAGLGMVIFSYGRIPVVGASGAIFGLLGAFALYWPERMVFIWGIFPIKMKHFVLIIGIFTLIAGFSEAQTGVAHLAHLFGLLMGLFYCWKLDPRQPLLAPLSDYLKSRKHKKKQDQWRQHEIEKQKLLRQADELLDKMDRVGWENLSAEEQRRIREISEKLSGSDMFN